MVGGKVNGVTDKVGIPQPVDRNNSQSILQQQLDDPSSKITKALKFTENYLVTPTCMTSLGFGILSFALHSFFKRENKFVCDLAGFASKAAVFSTSVFGSLRNGCNKDLVGTIAFAIDFFTSIFGSAENLYLLKGFGSGLDHTPLILTEVANNPRIIDEYGLEEGKEEAFNQYTGFLDSFKKTISAVKIIFRDIADGFKKHGFAEGLSNNFLTGERTAEKNLLISGIGIIVGAASSFIPGMHTAGASLRDLFGIYADLSYYDKGMSETSGSLDSKSKKHYRLSGIEYTVGSVLDLIYRWTKMEGLNLFALGVDRLGACDAVKGIVREIEETWNGERKTNNSSASEATPVLAPQSAGA